MGGAEIGAGALGVSVQSVEDGHSLSTVDLLENTTKRWMMKRGMDRILTTYVGS